MHLYTHSSAQLSDLRDAPLSSRPGEGRNAQEAEGQRESVEVSATNGTSGPYFTPSRLRDNHRRADRKPVRARGGGPARECLLDMTGPCTDDRIAAVVDGQDLDKIKPISMPE